MRAWISLVDEFDRELCCFRPLTVRNGDTINLADIEVRSELISGDTHEHLGWIKGTLKVSFNG